MKLNKILLGISATALLASSAGAANLTLTLTGSTAFRNAVYDRIEKAMFGGGLVQVSTNPPAPGNVLKWTYGKGGIGGADILRYAGTVTNGFGGYTNQFVIINCSFSGSLQGYEDVKKGNVVPIITGALTNNPNSTNAAAWVMGTAISQVALSDVFTTSAGFKNSDFSDVEDNLCVIPFVFATTNALSNITRDQAYLLMTASYPTNVGYIKDTFLGGTANNNVLLVGRTSDSGTRLSVEKVIGFSGSEIQWSSTNNGASWFASDGQTSGSLVNGLLKIAATNTTYSLLGYVGLGDAGGLTKLQYNGVNYTAANVTNGLYAVWGYEHSALKTAPSPDEQSLYFGLVGALKNPGFTSTNSLFSNATDTPSFININNMRVYRANDGTPIKGKTF